jgi:serine/threonine protein phosphatase PrpC
MQGRRHDMEDKSFVYGSFVDPSWDLFIVADGHGGSATAKRVASDVALELVEHMSKHFSVEQIKDAMELTFEIVDERIRTWQAESHDGSGACLVCALVTPTHFIVASCGDCVAFLFRLNDDGTRVTRELTRDHEPSLPEERARIEAAGHRVVLMDTGGGRIDGDLNISRAFGDSIFKHSAPLARMPRFNEEGLLVDADPSTLLTHKTFAITAHPDIVIVERTPQDIMLLLGSDGLVDIQMGTVTDKHLVPTRLWNAAQLEGVSDPTHLAMLACDEAYIHKSADNISAVVWTNLPSAWRAPEADAHAAFDKYMSGRRNHLGKAGDHDEPDPFEAKHEEF